jgi:hypothetical protein
MAEAETAFHKVYKDCEIRIITQLYDSVIIATHEEAKNG